MKAFTDTIGLRVIGGFGVFDVIEGKVAGLLQYSRRDRQHTDQASILCAKKGVPDH
ncbi:MAG: hypothetical protein ABIN99_11735 [Nitrosospira sp.]